ncbi:MAG TPA: hypothetical protein VF623_11105, partial [Segetibacter sp.]
MKKIISSLIVLLPYFLLAQPYLKDIRQKSYQSFAFRISAAEVENYIMQDSIPVDQFLRLTPAYIFHKDSVHTDLLPIGHYILISVEENEVVANMIGITNLIVYPVNNRYNIQLDIRTQDGIFVPNANVWVNNKEAKYNTGSKSYWVKQQKLATGLVKVYGPTDTTFIQLDAKEDNVLPVWKQRWKNFTTTKTGRVLTWLPVEVGSIFKRHGRHYNNNSAGASGYILFNQPKYKLTDTVKLKAYIVDKKWKRFTEKTNVFLEYNARGKSYSQLLTSLSPISPGSYVYSFPLNDTLVSDISYNIIFKTKKGKNIIRKNFSTEDYLLDEIGSYQLRSKSENHYLHDTMSFYASAKDANGLSLLDGKATLVLTTNTINEFYKDSLQVPDTLYTQEKSLATDGETQFNFPTDRLPDARLHIKATIVFKNSNNELHEEAKYINYSPGAKDLVATANADSVFATYMVNGKSVETAGTVEISGDEVDRKFKVNFPVRLKIDPLAATYKFTTINGGDTSATKVDIISNYWLLLQRESVRDTVGFTLRNPYKIPVTFVVLDGKTVVASGKDDNEKITWKKVINNKRKMYTVKWQYTWGRTQREGSDNIALLYKLLQIKVSNQPTVFPGQKDTVSIEVKDYKNRPAEGVNLAVVAYNSQFKKSIDVRDPPYLVKYKNRKPITRDRHETDDPYILKKYKLGDHQNWSTIFLLDSMQYYKMLFPKTFPYDVVTPINDFIPQTSIHVIKKGVPQEIYLLYINRQLVYFNGVTDKMKYAFETMPGFTQVEIRLLDKIIHVDSIYIQPFYKHDIIIDLDSLPANSIVKKATNYWTNEEKNIIENTVWQLDNNAKTNNGYVWQNTKSVKLNSSGKHLVGPFNRLDSLHFYAPGDFDIHFAFEPG